MKNSFLLLLLSLCILCTSCFSFSTPYKFSSSYQTGDYEFLGNVSTEVKSSYIFSFGGDTDFAYSKLFQVAQFAFPECNALKDVYIDKKVTSYFGVYTEIVYRLTGSAIKIKNTSQT